ncbi:muramoyltetrapeptide carboxypeptidase [Luteibacter aegosomatissinici]|uniref:muramoyltetrapeptide carboxypeptidase n=1 Tax=Luteibacter aegosomatissinici TaxID=2911539 RepID=UPI001FF9B497|nr:muramoyltetrapeptide carboxypeptidase [Luteibacter aegosomatissinici]UPG93663.1 muramoyltetrapeptide carboxypeptidase [Luteibacter aegosomatissinici]
MPDTYDIRLIAPAGYPHNPEAMRIGIERLEAAGHRVHAKDVLKRRELRFAGTDAQRAADINALADPGQPLPDIALAIRGGYGAHPILPLLDYDALRARLGGTPLPLVGHSDFTALQCALLARSGLPTLGGPMLGPDFGAPELDALTWDHFWATLASGEGRASWDTPDTAELAVEGTIWGGNLAMLSGLVGSEYFPRIEGGILFIEDIAEPPYRVERMLYHLLHAGVLGRQKALLIGDFTSCRVAEYDNGYDLPVAFERIGAAAGIPLVRGLPFGHGPAKFTLPFGIHGQLDVAGGRARLAFSGHPRPKTP